MPLSCQSCFHRLAALEYALRNCAIFEQVILLDEYSLVMGRGLDVWLEQQLSQDDRIGLVGAQLTGTYSTAYRANLPILDELRVPHQRWEKPPPSLDDAFLGLRYEAAKALFEKGWLATTDVVAWFGSPGHYVSWLLQMMGWWQLSWGYTDRPLPPLFVWEDSALQPPPHILSGDFKYYARLNRALAYSEVDLRESYKRHRGETCRVVPPLAPQLSPGQPGE